MESCGEPLKIHISPQCKEKLERLGGYITEERGIISMKGKGDVITYWLIGKQLLGSSFQVHFPIDRHFQEPPKAQLKSEMSIYEIYHRHSSVVPERAPNTLATRSNHQSHASQTSEPQTTEVFCVRAEDNRMQPNDMI